MDSDFFLSNSEEDFMKHARLYIFESYCRIHERIDLSMLARKLNMEQVYSLAIIRLKRPG